MHDSNQNLEEIKAWQKKLASRISEQLRNPVLDSVLISFKNRLREDFSELSQDWDSIAQYLVIGQGDRHKKIVHFLSSAQQYSADKSIEEPIKSLLAYILQILVRKCHEEDDKGVTRIPVDELRTVKLIGATRTTFPHIPDNQDFENGQKNASFQNIGRFLPETGELEDLEKICKAIVDELLVSLNETPENSYNKSFNKLKGQLSAYSSDPENAPFQGLYVKQGIGYHPLHIDAVASRLRNELGDLLWVYIYGSGSNSDEWLYADEEKIRGLVSRYNRDVIKQKPILQDNNSSGEKMKPSVFVSYSHNDQDRVEEFVKRLTAEGLHVVIDKTHLKPGEDISTFILRSIKETNATICIVSRSSLLSPWVAMETVNTFHLQQWSNSKRFIACFLEDNFFEPSFRIKATIDIDEKINEISILIPEYDKLKIDSTDLNQDKSRLIKLRNELSDILQKLKSSKSLDIRPTSWDSSLGELCNYLKGY